MHQNFCLPKDGAALVVAGAPKLNPVLGVPLVPNNPPLCVLCVPKLNPALVAVEVATPGVLKLKPPVSEGAALLVAVPKPNPAAVVAVAAGAPKVSGLEAPNKGAGVLTAPNKFDCVVVVLAPNWKPVDGVVVVRPPRGPVWATGVPKVMLPAG